MNRAINQFFTPAFAAALVRANLAELAIRKAA
jgi:hypothetical protein